MSQLPDAAPSVQVSPGEQRRTGQRIAAILSFKIWGPLLLLSIAAIAVSLSISTIRRNEALHYLDEHKIEYELTTDSEWITEQFGDRAVGLRSVRSISFYNLPEKGWRHIAVLDETTEVTWGHLSPMSDSAKAAIERLAHIEHAHIYGDTPDRVWFFATHPRLKHIDFHNAVSNETMLALSRLPALSHLELHLLRPDAGMFGGLHSTPTLRHFSIDGDIDGPGIEWLSRSPHLETLSFHNAGVTDDELAPLASARELREVQFVYCPFVSAEGFRHLALLPKLTHITLTPNKLSAEALAVFQGMPALTHVIVHGTIPADVRTQIDSGAWRFAIEEPRSDAGRTGTGGGFGRPAHRP